jgi:hypothetical protein
MYNGASGHAHHSNRDGANDRRMFAIGSYLLFRMRLLLRARYHGVRGGCQLRWDALPSGVRGGRATVPHFAPKGWSTATRHAFARDSTKRCQLCVARRHLRNATLAQKRKAARTNPSAVAASPASTTHCRVLRSTRSLEHLCRRIRSCRHSGRRATPTTT